MLQKKLRHKRSVKLGCRDLQWSGGAFFRLYYVNLINLNVDQRMNTCP